MENRDWDDERILLEDCISKAICCARGSGIMVLRRLNYPRVGICGERRNST